MYFFQPSSIFSRFHSLSKPCHQLGNHMFKHRSPWKHSSFKWLQSHCQSRVDLAILNSCFLSCPCQLWTSAGGLAWGHLLFLGIVPERALLHRPPGIRRLCLTLMVHSVSCSLSCTNVQVSWCLVKAGRWPWSHLHYDQTWAKWGSFTQCSQQVVMPICQVIVT